MKVIVFHSYYGCDTGCCGHVVQLEDGREEFFFDHPYNKNDLQFVRDLVTSAFGAEHVADIDWENVIIDVD